MDLFQSLTQPIQISALGCQPHWVSTPKNHARLLLAFRHARGCPLGLSDMIRVAKAPNRTMLTVAPGPTKAFDLKSGEIWK